VCPSGRTAAPDNATLVRAATAMTTEFDHAPSAREW
jgi:hypothetical protein